MKRTGKMLSAEGGTVLVFMKRKCVNKTGCLPTEDGVCILLLAGGLKTAGT